MFSFKALIKEFENKLGIDKLFSQSFKTNDSALFCYHTDRENLLQMIYMIIAGYFEDDTSDEITNDPVFKAVLYKDTLITTNHYGRYKVCNPVSYMKRRLIFSHLPCPFCMIF